MTNTKHRAASLRQQSYLFIISYFSFGFTSAYNSILFCCCLRRNVKPCRHTHDLSWLCIVRERAWSPDGRIPAVYDQRYKCHNLRDGGRIPLAIMLTTPRLLQRQQQAYKLRDAISDLPHLHSTSPLGRFPSVYRHPVWYGKTRMAWLPDGEKISKISLFVLHNARTWQTHTQTPHDGIGRAYASHRASKIMVIVNSYRMVNSLNRWFYLLVRHVNCS